MAREWSPKSVYEVLDAVRMQPAMFLGEASMNALQAFLSGLSFAELRPGTPPFWDFSHWASTAMEETAGSWSVMEERVGSLETMNAYFHYLDQYRRCRSVHLAHTIGPFRPKHVATGPGRRKQTGRMPDRLWIGQFSPSSVFFVEVIVGKERTRHSPFYRTEAAAKHEAEQRWGFEPKAWKRR